MSRIISPPPTPMLQGGMPPLTDGTIAKGPAQGGGTIQGSPQGSEGVAKGEATAQTNPSSTVSPTQAPQKGSFEAHQTTKLLGAEAPTLGNLLGKDDILSSAGLSKAGLGFLIAEKALEKGKMEGDVGKADGKAGTAIGFGDLGGKLNAGKDAKADLKGQDDKGLLAPKSTPQARTIQRSVLQGASEGTRTAQGDSLSSQNTAKGASVGMSGQTKAAHSTGMADPLGSGGAKLTSSNGTLPQSQGLDNKGLSDAAKSTSLSQGKAAEGAQATVEKGLAQASAQGASNEKATDKASLQNHLAQGASGKADALLGGGKEAAQSTLQTAAQTTTLGAGAAQLSQNKADLSQALPQTAANTQTAAQTTGKPTSGSVQDLLMNATTQTSAQDGSPDSPRQQLKQLVFKWASAQEAVALQNLHTVMLHDVTGVSNRIASLAQQGVIPSGELMSLLTKVLKKPGQRKLMDKIKDMLIKQGASSCMSAEMLQLIAAMIATNLAKAGDDDAEALLIDLFDRPSRRIELPEGGGSYHEEGREEQEHQERIFFDPSEDSDA